MGADRQGIALIIISSILLGIWATVNTIALRNILLVLGAIIAIAYWTRWFKSDDDRKLQSRFQILDWLPFGLMGLMFVWVIAHYLFFSNDPRQQWAELTSTWLRAFLAVTVGSATGLALQRHFKFAWALYLGLIISFLILIGQYIPKAVERKSFFVSGWFTDYIYWAKFSGVLAGSILVAGLIGMLIDCFAPKFLVNQRNSMDHHELGGTALQSEKQLTISSYVMLIYCFFGIALAFYAFVFVFDAKAGVGVSVILIGFWIAIATITLFLKSNQGTKDPKQKGTLLKSVAFLALLICAVTWFSIQHMKNNPGWDSLFKDMALSAQIEKYPNWQDPNRYGFPKHDDGQMVRGNTYERVAMAVAGLQVIEKDPIGHGVLRSFTQQIKRYYPEYKSHPYTHSAWIDLGLSFGWPGLLLIPTVLLIVLMRMIRQQSSPYRATVTSLCLTMLILYTVGEYGFQHGIEILFFIAALVGGLAITRADRHQSSN